MNYKEKNLMFILLLLCSLFFAGSGCSGSNPFGSGSGTSVENMGKLSISINWPTANGQKLIPAGTQSIYIIFTCDKAPTSTATLTRTATEVTRQFPMNSTVTADIQAKDTNGIVISEGLVSTTITKEEQSSSITLSATHFLYCANSSNSTVQIMRSYDYANYTSVGSVTVGSRSMGMDLDNNKRYLYMSNEDDDTVSVVDTQTSSVAATIAVGDRPRKLVVSADNNWVFCANTNSSTVSQINASNWSIFWTHNILNGVSDISEAPDVEPHYNLYIACGGNWVSVLDLLSQIPTDYACPQNSASSILALNTINKFYVWAGGENTVAVYSKAPAVALQSTFNFEETPGPFTALYVNKKWGYESNVYAVYPSQKKICVMRASDDVVIQRIFLSFEPYNMVFNSTGTYAFISSTNKKVYVMRLSDYTITANIDVPFPNASPGGAIQMSVKDSFQ